MPTLTRVEDQIEVPDRLPVVALRDLVFFPYIVLPILIGRRRSVAALEAAQDDEGLVLLELAPGVTLDEVKEKTEPDFRVAESVRETAAT